MLLSIFFHYMIIYATVFFRIKLPKMIKTKSLYKSSRDPFGRRQYFNLIYYLTKITQIMIIIRWNIHSNRVSILQDTSCTWLTERSLNFSCVYLRRMIWRKMTVIPILGKPKKTNSIHLIKTFIRTSTTKFL